MTRSTDLALGASVDHVRLARLLRRAHAIAIDTGVAPRMVRTVVSESWKRSAAAGVDPVRPAPRMLDPQRTAERLAAHPVAAVLPRVRSLLQGAMAASGYFAAFSDAMGVLLWSDGSARALESAVTPRFLPGFACREDQIGTNAIGTALVVDQPVQIFSAEHFNELLHGWTCAAAPVHDPSTGEVLGAIDLSGGYRTAHVHGLALVEAVASAVEGFLVAERSEADAQMRRRYRERYGEKMRRFSALVDASGRVVQAEPPDWLGGRVDVPSGSAPWPHRDGQAIEAESFGGGFLVWRSGRARPRPSPTSITVLGTGRARVVAAGRPRSLNLRHSEIVALLALHPDGMTVRELALALYGDPLRSKTVRAEIARLRAVLPDAVLSRPYRLDERIHVDVANAWQRLAASAEGPAAAVRPCAAPLLPRSTAPGVVAARHQLVGELRMQPSRSLDPRMADSPDAT